MNTIQFEGLTRSRQYAEIYESLGGTMNKIQFESHSEDRQLAYIWEAIDTGAAPVDSLPDQTGEGGSFLRTNGTVANWSTDGSQFTDLDAEQLIGDILRARINNALSANPAPIAATTLSASGLSTLSNLQAAGVLYVNNASGNASIWNNGSLGWSSTSDPDGTMDLILRRDSANTLAQRNATAAQRKRTYKTWTDDSNGEWVEVGALGTIGGVATCSGLITRENGTGVPQSLVLGTFGSAGINIVVNNSTKWQFNTDGSLTTYSSNAQDFGEVTYHPRSIYFGTSLFRGATKILGAQGAAIADATDAATAISQLNLFLAAARTHGFIAT